MSKNKMLVTLTLGAFLINSLGVWLAFQNKDQKKVRILAWTRTLPREASLEEFKKYPHLKLLKEAVLDEASFQIKKQKENSWKLVRVAPLENPQSVFQIDLISGPLPHREAHLVFASEKPMEAHSFVTNGMWWKQDYFEQINPQKSLQRLTELKIKR